MNKTDTIEKVYWSIGEVADMFNVATSQLRFWESEVPLLKPKKNSSGNRKYTKDDIAVIRKITTLMREEGFTLSGVKKQLEKQEDLGFCPCCGSTGYVLTVDGIKAHVLMSTNEPISKETQDALAQLIKAAYKKEVQHG